MPATRGRLEDIKTCIGYIRETLAGKSLADLENEWSTRFTFERCLEVISEASRHIPDGLKASHGATISWQHVAALGNVLRHAYHRSNVPTLWSIYEDDLDTLEAAVDAMLAALPSPPAPLRS